MPREPERGIVLFGRRHLLNINKRNDVTDAERIHDIEQKLRCWGYLSHYPDAERDLAWLLEELAPTELKTQIPPQSYPCAGSRSRMNCTPSRNSATLGCLARSVSNSRVKRGV